MKVIQVTLEESVHSSLKDAAKKKRISMAEVVRQILSQWVTRRIGKKGGAA